MEMRKLTPEEIDDAPSWAISYAAFTKDGNTYVIYHERHFGYTLPLPKREEFETVILEMINEWSKGCSSEPHNPVGCPECTTALIDAIANKLIKQLRI